jgi:hypothetical protein
MVGSLAPMGASILEEILRTAGIRLAETARTFRSLKSNAKVKKITRKSQGNFRVMRLEKWQTNLHYRI